MHAATVDWRDGPAVHGLALASGRARLSLDAAWPPKGAPYLHLKLDRFDLATLPAVLVPGGRWHGRLDVEAAFQEQRGHRLASLRLALRRARVPRVSGRWDLGGSFAYARGKLAGRASLASGHRGLLRADLAAALPARRVDEARDGRALADLLLHAPARLAGRLGPLGLGELERALGLRERLQGALSGRWRLRGSALHPRGIVELRSMALAVDDREIGDVALSLEARSGRTAAAARIRRPAQRAEVDVQASVERSAEALRDLDRAGRTALEGRLTVSHLPLELVSAQDVAPFTGTLGGDARLSGSLDRPAVRGELEVRELALRGQPLGWARSSFAWDGRDASVTAGLRQPLGGSLDLRLALPLRTDVAGGRLSVSLDRTAPLRGSLDARAVDLAFLSGLGGDLRSAAGRLQAKLAVAGTAAAPELNGPLAISGGRLALRGLGSYHDVALAATLGGRTGELEKLSVGSGLGTLDGRGRLTWPGESPTVQVAASLQARDFALWTEDQLRGMLTSHLDLEGKLGWRSGDLTIRASDASLRLPVLGGRELEPLTLDPGIEIVGSEPTPSAHPYALTAHVATAGSATVTGPDVNLPVRADLIARLGAETRISGRVDSGKGTITIYGRRLDVSHAALDFGPLGGPGRSPDDPLLSGQAEQKTQVATVYAGVSGTLRLPEFDLRSDPPLSHAQIATLLVSGTVDTSSPTSTAARSEATSPGAARGTTVAASAAGVFLSEALRGPLGEALPIDVLTLEPSYAEVGKRIGPLYIGAVENFGVTDPRRNQSEIRASYHLSKGLSLNSVIGDAGADSLDLNWEKSW